MTQVTLETSVFFTKPYTPRWRIRITRADGAVDNVSSRNIATEIMMPVTVDIGRFKCKLSNIGGKISNLYKSGDVIRFDADMSAGTTQKFQGRIDSVNEVIDSGGAYLEIVGRHKAFELTETYVTAKYENTEISQILRGMISTFLPAAYTTTNITSTNKNITMQFDNKIFWDCVIDLCNMAKISGNSFDCYVDDDLDFHFFQEKTISNNDEAIVEGDNFIWVKDFGDDSTEIRDKVTIRGSDDEGVPIIYTSGTGTREYSFQDNTIKTFQQAKDKADALANEMAETIDKGTARSKWMETLKQGDYIWFSVPRQSIHGQVRILQHKIIIDRSGIWSECEIERKILDVSWIINKLSKLDYTTKSSSNPNAMRYSYNMSFNDTTQIESSSNLTVENGESKQSALGTNATFTTFSETTTIDIAQAELRIIGQDLESSTFEISANNGVNYTVLTKNTAINISPSGAQLKVKATLKDNSTNLLPVLKSLAILYS